MFTNVHHNPRIVGNVLWRCHNRPPRQSYYNNPAVADLSPRITSQFGQPCTTCLSHHSAPRTIPHLETNAQCHLHPQTRSFSLVSVTAPYPRCSGASDPIMDDVLNLKLEATIRDKYTVHRVGQRGKEKWVREKVIGQGTFGRVWLERQTSSGTFRAVKEVGKHVQVDHLKEIRAIAEFSKVLPPSNLVFRVFEVDIT